MNSAGSSVSPSAPIHSGTATINRTLLHHQQNHAMNGVNVSATRNGATSTLRGLAINSNSSDSPPPDYNHIVVHDTNRHGLIFHVFYYFCFVFVRLNSREFN